MFFWWDASATYGSSIVSTGEGLWNSPSTVSHGNPIPFFSGFRSADLSVSIYSNHIWSIKVRTLLHPAVRPVVDTCDFSLQRRTQVAGSLPTNRYKCRENGTWGSATLAMTLKAYAQGTHKAPRWPYTVWSFHANEVTHTICARDNT